MIVSVIKVRKYLNIVNGENDGEDVGVVFGGGKGKDNIWVEILMLRIFRKKFLGLGRSECEGFED